MQPMGIRHIANLLDHDRKINIPISLAIAYDIMEPIKHNL